MASIKRIPKDPDNPDSPARAWRIQVTIGRNLLGKRKVITRTFPKKKQAEDEARRLEGLKNMGGLGEPSRDPLAKYLNGWAKTVAKPRLRARTFADYEGILTRYIFSPPEGAPLLGSVKMHQLSPEAIQTLYTWLSEERGLSPRTIASLHAVLRSALNHAASTGAIARNPARYAKPPKQVRKEMKAMNEEEAMTFLKAAEEDPHYPLWVLLISTGLRPGEALGLEWTDLEVDRLRVQRSLTRQGVKGWELTEPKTARGRRTVVLPPMVLDALQGQRTRQAEKRLKAGPHWTDHGLIFTTPLGEPLEQTNIYQRNFRPILEKAELGFWEGEGENRTFKHGFNMYSLRHTAASLALRAGNNVKVVSAMLGHASVVLTLDTYTHLVETQQEEEAESMQRVLGGVG